jgi:hypothetical protein
MKAGLQVAIRTCALACLLTLATSCWGQWGTVEGKVVRDPIEARGILSAKLIAMPDSSEVIYFRMEDYVVGLPSIWAVVLLRNYIESQYLDESNETVSQREQKPLIGSAECTTLTATALRDFNTLGFDTSRTTSYCGNHIELSVRQQGPDLVLFLNRDGH